MNSRATLLWLGISAWSLLFAPASLLADGGKAVSVTGVLTTVHADDLEGKRSRNFYFLEEIGSDGRSTGRSFEVNFRKGPPKAVPSGSIVKVRGSSFGGAMLVASEEEGDFQVLEGAPAALASNNALVIIANFSDASVTCSRDDVTNRIFGPMDSVDWIYREVSKGQLGFSGDVAGPYTLRSSSSGCDIWGWASEADRLASADGYSPNSYAHKVYVMPRNDCGWSGWGTYGGSPSHAWIFYCNVTDLYSHEIGHNVGMRHAATPTNEYGDRSDFMGGGGSPRRGLNAPHKMEMGWLPSGNVLATNQAGTYELLALSVDPSVVSSTAPQTLRLTVSGKTYYISYRSNFGYDEGLSIGYAGRTSIHTWSGPETNTYLQGLAGDGETFTGPSGNFTITQVSHDSTSAVVVVSFDQNCVPETPSVAAVDPDQMGSPGVQLVYSYKLTNDNGCASDGLQLSARVPSGWLANLSTENLDMGPGETAAVTLNVTSADTASGGDYLVTLDVAGPTGTSSAGAHYVIDSTPPTTPTGLQASTKRNQVRLSWNNSSDDVGVGGYIVWRNGVTVGQVDGSGYTDSAVETGMTYSYEVEAFDVAGNLSAPAGPLDVALRSKGGGGGKGRRK